MRSVKAGTLTYLCDGKEVGPPNSQGHGGVTYTGLRGLTLYPAFSTNGSGEMFTLLSQEHGQVRVLCMWKMILRDVEVYEMWCNCMRCNVEQCHGIKKRSVSDASV